MPLHLVPDLPFLLRSDLVTRSLLEVWSHLAWLLAAVEAALQALPGVDSAAVSLTVHQAEVQYRTAGGDTAANIEAQLVAAVQGCGFEASVVQPAECRLQLLQVQGMTCSSCSSAVEAALRAVAGVQSAAVNLISGVAEVAFDPAIVGPRHLVEAVQGAGFEATPLSGQRLAFVDSNRRETAVWWRQFRNAAILTLPVFLSEWLAAGWVFVFIDWTCVLFLPITPCCTTRACCAWPSPALLCLPACALCVQSPWSLPTCVGCAGCTAPRWQGFPWTRWSSACSPPQSSLSAAGASTAAPTPRCEGDAQTWMCWCQWALTPPTSTHSSQWCTTTSW